MVMRHEFMGLRLKQRDLPVGGVRQVVSNVAVGLAALPAVANVALIQVRIDPIRMRLDGVAPTTSSGMEWLGGDTIELEGRELLQIAQVIRGSGIDVVLEITYLFRGEEVQNGTS